MNALANSHSPPVALQEEVLEQLASMLIDARRLVVLTGAGCSTDSGIPDYRNSRGEWKRSPPMRFEEFMGSHAARQRYWARALVGWRQFRDIQPNTAHHVLAEWEAEGRISSLITQNVDRLHQLAGSHAVIDLHGRIDQVECMECRSLIARDIVQAELAALNPGWQALDAVMAPDGDALLDVNFSSFRLTTCLECGGILKPAVVFFGESVPRQRVVDAFAQVHQADLLLVVGSSLMVFSGYRFVRAACERGIASIVINRGHTRADAEVTLKVEGGCGDVLCAVRERLGP